MRKLTRPQISELEAQRSRGGQHTYGKDRARVQNRLVELGLSKWIEVAGSTSCFITEKGVEYLKELADHRRRPWRFVDCDWHDMPEALSKLPARGMSPLQKLVRAWHLDLGLTLTADEVDQVCNDDAVLRRTLNECRRSILEDVEETWVPDKDRS